MPEKGFLAARKRPGKARVRNLKCFLLGLFSWDASMEGSKGGPPEFQDPVRHCPRPGARANQATVDAPEASHE